MEWILNNNVIAYAVTAILGAIGSKLFFARKVEFLQHLLLEVSQLLKALTDALKPDPDGTVIITPEEAQRIRNEITDVIRLFRPKK